MIKEHSSDLLNKESVAVYDIELLGDVVADNEDLCKEFTILEIANMLRNLPMNKSGGLGAEDEIGQLPGDIPIEIIKYAADEDFIEQLKICFDDIILNDNIPKCFLKSVCIYLYKKGDVTVLDNYRGLCLNNNLYKLFIKMIVDRLVNHCEKNKVLSEDQQGFRFGRSCNDANSIFTTMKNLCFKYQKNLFVGFIDIKKAYDSVDRILLWRILRHIGVPQQLVNIIRKLYEEAETCIRVGDNLSSYFKTNMGLKQGCPLSPLLFIIYFEFAFRIIHDLVDESKDGIDLISAVPSNDIIAHTAGSDQQFGIIRHPLLYGEDKIRLSKSFKILKLLFADDAAIFNYSSDGLKRVLSICNEVFIKFNLELAISKTEVMIFINNDTNLRKLEFYSNDKDKEQYFEYYERMNENENFKPIEFRLITVESIFTPIGIPTCKFLKKLNIVEKFKYLGNLYVPDSDSFEKQINKAKMNAEFKFQSYCKSKGIYDKNTYYDKIDKITHFLSIIVPTLLYSIEIWSITEKMVNELNSWLYGKILFIFNLRRRHHVSFATLISTLQKHGLKVYPFHILIAARRLKYHGNVCRKEDHSYTKLMHFGTLKLNSKECKVRNGYNWRSKLLIRDSLEEDLQILNLTEFQLHHTVPELWNKLIDEGCTKALNFFFKIEAEKSLERAKHQNISKEQLKKSEEIIERNVSEVLNHQSSKVEKKKQFQNSIMSKFIFSKNSGLNDNFDILSKRKWSLRDIKLNKLKNHYTNKEKGIVDERERDVTYKILNEHNYFNKCNQENRLLNRSLYGRKDHLSIHELNTSNSVTFRNMNNAKMKFLDNTTSQPFINLFNEFKNLPYKLEIQHQQELEKKKENVNQKKISKEWIDQRRLTHPHEFCSLTVKSTGVLCTIKPLVGDTLCKVHKKAWDKEVAKNSKSSKTKTSRTKKTISIPPPPIIINPPNPATPPANYCPAIIKKTGLICGRITLVGNVYCTRFHDKLENKSEL